MPEPVPIPSPGVPLYFGEPGQPLVVVVHDWYGRLPWLEAIGRAFAHNGYRVAVPDLYNGVCTTDAATAQSLMQQLDVGASLALINELIATARAEGSSKIATVGFSLGGWLALLHAQGGDVDAVVAYYATLAESNHGVIPSPVMLHFAETDTWEPGEEPHAFMERLRDHGTPVSDHNYLGTLHSFANASITELVDTRAAALAFARTMSFLGDHLGD
ncbi:MAG: dienelactone hydrolase family protein [Microbacteriaceae bacterium]